MKKIKNLIFKSLLLIFILGTPSFIYSQTLVENKIDDFTNNSIKRTSWETFNMNMRFTAYFRISKINDNILYDLKMMLGSGKVFSIAEGQEVMFKMDDNEIIKLPNLEFAVTCKGCGAKGYSGSAAQGIQTSYSVNNKQLEKLKNGTITKVRIYTKDGYIENDMKDKNAEKIKYALKLIE